MGYELLCLLFVIFDTLHFWSKRVLHIVRALYCMYIVVEVTMNMAKYTSSWQSAAGAAEERQYLNQLPA